MMNVDWIPLHLSSDSMAWLDSQRRALAHTDVTPEIYAIASAHVQRKVGTELLPAHEADPALPIRDWPQADAARIWLLYKVLSFAREPKNFLQQAYALGDDNERAAMLRGLCWLDPHGNAVDLAVNACRTNRTDLFAAIALHNAYPMQYFTERAFNQLCMKALFNGLSAENIIGLPARGNSELSRMGQDFAQERLDAHRDIPPTLWLAIAPRAEEAAQTLIIQHLDDPQPEQRYYASMAIARSPHTFSGLRRIIMQHHSQTQDVAVSAFLETFLQS
jgi:hypothetical protein